MSSISLKKIFSFVMVLVVAMASGFLIGKIYIDSTYVPPLDMSGTEADYRDDEEIKKVESLVALANGGKDLSEFSQLELFQIAEYNLEHSEYFLKEGLGTAASCGATCNMRLQKIKYGDHYGFYKFSPSEKVMGVETPAVCVRTIYDAKKHTMDLIKVKKPNFISRDANNMQVEFSNTTASGNVVLSYKNAGGKTAEELYAKRFKTVPTRALSYLITSKTTTAENFSETTLNEDGSCTFDIKFVPENSTITATLYYSREVQFACSYSVPYWTMAKGRDYSILLRVTIDKNFKFKQIYYYESYTEYGAKDVDDPYAIDNIPLLSSAPVINEYTDYFYFDKETIASKVVDDFKNFEEIK